MNPVNIIIGHRAWTRYGVTIAWCVSALCLLAVVGSTGWTMHTQAQIKARNYAPQDITAPVRIRHRGYQVNDIVAANLFGDPTPKPVVQKAPETTLDLTLLGILWASDEAMARAIIQTGKKKSELYSVGEAIKGAGASIKEIRDGEVLLNRNGALESLPLIKKTDSGNRQIITYKNPQPAATDPQVAYEEIQATNNNSERRSARRPLANNRSAERRAAARNRAPNGAPRKIRKPNFSGLDRALKKMGEL